MKKCRFTLSACIIAVAALTACGMREGTVSSYDYQPEAPNKVPGHNLYRPDALDISASQRANLYTRSDAVHDSHQDYLHRLKEAKELDQAAQKLGREPGSLFRQ